MNNAFGSNPDPAARKLSAHNPLFTMGDPDRPLIVPSKRRLTGSNALIVPSPKLPTRMSPPTSPKPAGDRVARQGAFRRVSVANRRCRLPFRSNTLTLPVLGVVVGRWVIGSTLAYCT